MWNLKVLINFIFNKNIFLAYEYVQDSEITAPTLQSESEEDLLAEKVKKIKLVNLLSNLYYQETCI